MSKSIVEYSLTRRRVLQSGVIAGLGLMVPWRLLPKNAFATSAALGLSDPVLQEKFVELAPNALHPSFKFPAQNVNKGEYKITIEQGAQFTGLRDAQGNRVATPVWGYGRNGRGVDWPGRTFEVQSGVPIEVKWENKLIGPGGFLPHLLPVDTNLHWCYSLHGYEEYTIASAGVPIVPHLHGGHSDYPFDGNPEFFFGPASVRGPRWEEKKFIYHNDQPAGNLWYHDHALGITRLNVYAGLAGFYFIRDEYDTGLPGNPLSLPAYPYELAYAIQDRMFYATGELFYPAYPGEPFYDDFITAEGAILPPALFPNGGPTALAEFFGDHMVVNGKIWPKENVEPRNYRMRLLNGCDSRFMALQFFEVPAEATDFATAAGPLEFIVIGSDQGLASSPTTVETLLFEPGARYDIIVNFAAVTSGNRVIMKNIAGDEPFGGDIPGPMLFEFTDRIMAFDVVLPLDTSMSDASPNGIGFGPSVGSPTRTRKVALFEGRDEFDRLQPLLGTAEPATDYQGYPINWPDTPVYSDPDIGLTGQMEGSIGWHSPTTENPALNTTEEWEIWNVTGDAHPIHLHLVHFEVLDRQEISWDSNSDEDGFIPEGSSPANDGIYLVTQPAVQHNSVAGNMDTYGIGFRIIHPPFPEDAYGAAVDKPEEIVENAPKDMVTALPGQITRIKATFDKPGRYVWHCHILSHEDHEMMRALHVGPGA